MGIHDVIKAHYSIVLGENFIFQNNSIFVQEDVGTFSSCASVIHTSDITAVQVNIRQIYLGINLESIYIAKGKRRQIKTYNTEIKYLNNTYIA